MMESAPIVVAAAVATSIGAKRDHNEDAFLADAPLFLVADGMGGYEAGEVASAAAISAFARLVGERAVDIEQMRDAYRAAGENVIAVGSGGRESAGTTLAGVAIADNGGVGYWLVLNVGDSRTYRFTDGKLEQISVDHSLVQELVDAGKLTAEQALHHANRNVVTRALGAGIVSDADFWMLPATVGDRMIVCSDGLSGEVGDDEIASILAAEADPDVAARRLIDAAMEHGGRDNITVIVVDALAVSRGDFDLDGDTVPRQTGVIS